MGGFVQQTFRLTDLELEFLRTGFNPYHLAKLIALEVWGRLFVLQDEQSAVNAHVNNHLQMAIA